jgi:phage repressor protein C with HTH and peptisase S24 domain
MLTGEQLGSAIEAAIKLKGVTKKEVAAHFGVQPPSIQDWVKRGTIGKEKLPKLWAYFSDVVPSSHWGLEAIPAAGAIDTSAHSIDPSVVPAYHAPDAVLVPILANCASMGPGADLLESDVIVGDLALSPHWINQYIRPQNPRELRFIHAYGDSMAPTFTDGDVLLVDTGLGARDPHSREGVYVLQAGGKNYVKRVTPTFDGKLQVTSDNPSSKTVQILNGDHQVDVVGRVVWAWSGKKL